MSCGGKKLFGYGGGNCSSGYLGSQGPPLPPVRHWADSALAQTKASGGLMRPQAHFGVGYAALHPKAQSYQGQNVSVGVQQAIHKAPKNYIQSQSVAPVTGNSTSQIYIPHEQEPEVIVLDGSPSNSYDSSTPNLQVDIPEQVNRSGNMLFDRKTVDEKVGYDNCLPVYGSNSGNVMGGSVQRSDLQSRINQLKQEMGIGNQYTSQNKQLEYLV